VNTLLRIEKLTRRFGGLTAVDGVSTAIENGEIRGLIGPNGAGKTTLLNLISGLIRSSSGSIELDGTDVAAASAHYLASLGVRRTFQNLKLFEGMTVLQNVLVGLHLQGQSGILGALVGGGRVRNEETTLHSQAKAALDMVGLSANADAEASSLSYGHKRLLEIARAIAAKPRILLLDEPAAGLNPTEAIGLAQLIRRINAMGVTIVMVEHHMDVVMTVCSKVTVLNYGKLLAEGSPDEIQNNEKVVEAYLGRAGLEERLAAYA
jgi:branched-chain amino acid transport system ATP-binding protein